mgnify:CR=1 FL=1
MSECPILTATRTGKKISSNPCQDCAFYGRDCLDDLANDLSEGVLKLAGAYIEGVKKATKEYIGKER